MPINKGLFSSNSEEWATPQAFFDEWDRQFHFTLDACASESNHKCEKYYDKGQDGLAQDWGGEAVWCNPPYGRNIGQWVRKCWLEGQKKDTKVVALLPARTDTKWFHDYVYYEALTYFLKGRLKFGDSKNSAPFPSMVCIWF